MTQGCGSWMKCLTSSSCSKSVENATTTQLFLNAVNSSLESFKSVMSELGLSDAQQSSVVTSVQTKAQELTSLLSLDEDTSYSGTVLENLTAMFSDLTEYAVTKIAEVAPSLDESVISNAVASFATNLVANAGDVRIFNSLPEDEQSNLPTDDAGNFDPTEILGPTVTQAVVGSMVTARPNVKPEDMVAAMGHFERKPGQPPMAPGVVKEYRPSDAERQEGRSKVQGDICQGHPSSMGSGGGRKPSQSMSDRIPLPMQGCQGVAIDKDVTFCLTAPATAFKVCSKNVYGSVGTATKKVIKFWVDGAENSFTAFPTDKVFDCSNMTARKELAQVLAAAIKEKKSTCSAFAPPPGSAGSQPPPAPAPDPSPPQTGG
jgi:hypothetical protein